jgi:hypothetical protein
MDMKRGEVYKVFEDPITKKKLEGHAAIMRIEETNIELGCHYCAVRFAVHESTVLRKVWDSDKVR